MNIFGSIWHEHIRFMSPLGCQYVVRTYWTDIHAAGGGRDRMAGNAVSTRRPHGERGEHPRLYKKGHPKSGVQFECSGRRGSNKKKGSSPPQGVKLISTTTTAFYSEP
ncbi:hypothetical protein EVAR_82252_1 [Eumeta japonica]|uniref:Uncharacterized protein n=1 Tax=Eumeta variegata TaxID=151549 RepID=A0A4C1VZ03_EUMVA|nr:hypothetical protein EVAR_82252_1 [Eumeta japonica]